MIYTSEYSCVLFHKLVC